jgi:hypothetical protein
MSKVTGRGMGSMTGKHLHAMPVLVAVLVAGLAACNTASPSASPSGGTATALPSASPSGETAAADPVTEEVEPGVERITSDGAGHDLEEKHPTNLLDMDDVYVTPDGTVWLSSSYSGTDNDANPPGRLVWALGQPETTQVPAEAICIPGEPDKPEALGVTCFGSGDAETKYLVGTHINALAAAPDGTYWAVGDRNLYHITPE